MFKWLMKKFIPSADTLAGYAAEGLAKSINGTDDSVTDKIAKYSQLAQKATEAADKLAAMLADGKINEDECATIQRALTPLFDKVLSLI